MIEILGLKKPFPVISNKKNAIQFLANQFINNGSIENKDILSSVDKFMINEKVKNNNITDIKNSIPEQKLHSV